jgi:hypothetical protein
MLMVGTSFCWNIIPYLESNQAYSRLDFYYYFNTDYTYPGKIHRHIDRERVDWKRDIFSRDIVLIDGRLYMVHSTGPQSAKLRDLRSNEFLTVPNHELREVTVAGTKNDVLDAVVLTETDREYQIMHPVTFRTVEIRKPRSFERTGETIKVFPYEGELYFIGN